MIRMDKIRKYMMLGLTVLSLVTITACGSKKETVGNNAVSGNIEQSTESATVAIAKNMQMQVKDADGNTVTLTGDATINESGEMVFEGKDSAGNVVKVTGTAEKTEDGSFKVKEAAVEGTSKVVADNGQETEVSNEISGDVTTDEIKNTTTEDVRNDTDDRQETDNNAGQNENISDGSEVKPETPVPDNKSEGNSASNSTPAAPEHTHTWSPVTTTVHHDATGHYEDVIVGTRTVVDKEAWDEPVYEWTAYAVKCLGCGSLFNSGKEWTEHSKKSFQTDSPCGSYTVLYRNEQVNTINHEAETHEENITEKRWVEDAAAYDETVTTGYVCLCGAIK